VNSRRALPSRLEPGPWILSGDVVVSGAAITVGPAARPEAMSSVCDAQVRAYRRREALIDQRAGRGAQKRFGPVGQNGGRAVAIG
jgi:hypothetical protein